MNPQKQNTMKEDTLDPAFTEYWTIHRDRLLREDSEYSAALESYAMKSGADWLLSPLSSACTSSRFSVLTVRCAT